MKKQAKIEEIELPENTQASIENGILKLSGKEGETSKNFHNPMIQLKVEGNKIILKTSRFTKREKKLLNTFVAHIKNMVKGVNSKHIYKLKICSSHFPMNVSINNNELVVKNFLGEKEPRKLKLKENAEVKLNGEEIVITSTSKETAGQIAGDIENLTRITNKDRRIFQDGIYIIIKNEKAM